MIRYKGFLYAGEHRIDWGQATQKQIISYVAKIGVFRDSSEWNWRFVRNFPVSRLINSSGMNASKWRKQYKEYLTKGSQWHRGYFKDMEEDYLKNPQAFDPVLIASEHSSELELNDGNHRVAIAIKNKIKTIPVLVGVPRNNGDIS